MTMSPVKEEEKPTHFDDGQSQSHHSESVCLAAFEAAVLPEDSDTGTTDFNDKVLGLLPGILERFGSLSAYLTQRYADQKELQDFASYLHYLCRSNEAFHDLGVGRLSTLPATQVSGNAKDTPTIQLPVAAFHFGKHASVRADPDHCQVLDMAEHILTEGFISVTDPIKGMQCADIFSHVGGHPVRPPWAGELLPFCVGFSKGRTRVHTLGILSLCHDNKLDVVEAWVESWMLLVSWQFSFWVKQGPCQNEYCHPYSSVVEVYVLL